MASKNWRKIICRRCDIQLKPTLLGGQSFRWTSPHPDEYIGVFQNAVWQLKQDDTGINFKVYRQQNKSFKNDEETLKKYLRLNVNLEELYLMWSQNDAGFKKLSKDLYGVRLLDQEVIENVFSFICSSNNNISRISSMVEKLGKMYGDIIVTLNDKTYYSFPIAASLAQSSVEAELKEAGFGYRAKFVHRAACKISSVGEKQWVRHIQSLDYPKAKVELMNIYGIGAKVADCICLMSLGHLEAVPVDTHVFRIANTYYMKNLKNQKMVSNKVYKEISDFFRQLYGPYAGWAQTVLFCNDLKAFAKLSEES